MSTVAKAEKIDCPECNSPMQLRESVHGLFYGCTMYPACRGTHSAHPNGKPMGTPATGPTKQARSQAHAAFDRLWKNAGSPMTRDEAYFWMQSKLGLSSRDAHIARMNADQCSRLIAHVEKELSK